VLGENGRFRLEETAFEPPGDDEIILRLEVAGLNAAHLDPAYRNAGPRTAVMVGTPVAVGARITGWTAERRALVLWSMLPEEEVEVVGLADHLRVPGRWLEWDAVQAIPDEIHPDTATLLPAAAQAARILRECRLPRGGTLVVAGLDLVGQILILMARHHRSAKVFASDPSPTLRRRAEWSGAGRVLRPGGGSLAEIVFAETDNAGADAVVVGAVDEDTLMDAAGALAVGATLCISGVEARSGALSFDVDAFWLDELRFIGVCRPDARGFRDAVGAVRQGLFDPDTLISKRIAWDELPEVRWDPEYWEHSIHVLVDPPPPPTPARAPGGGTTPRTK
jgi:threonine dehydrogenase-like Zn-dependent dehydrogenase